MGTGWAFDDQGFPGELIWDYGGSGGSFAPVGMEVSQGGDFAVKLTQKEFASNLKPLLTAPDLRTYRQRI